MAVIVLTSAKGAPGVTTTALALTLAWPRPVLLLEADVSGSSSILAGYYQGQTPHDKGLIDLALAHRRGTLTDGLHTASIELPGGQARLIPGLTGPSQAATMQPVWEPIAVVLSALERTGTDVIVDAGRLGTTGGPTPLLYAADVTLLTTRTTLPAVAATRAWAQPLREDLTRHGPGADALGLLLVGEGQPYNAREIQTFTGTPVISAIGWDPVHAEVFSRGATARKLDTSTLVRSVRAAASTIQSLIASRRDRLNPGSLVGIDGTHA